MPSRSLVPSLAIASLWLGAACSGEGGAELLARSLLPRQPAVGWSEVDVPPRPPRADPSAEATFAAACAPCHGARGDGRGPLAQHLRVPPADFTRGDFKLKSTVAEAPPHPGDLFRTITAGIPASGMPSFAHLPAGTRWALAMRVASFAGLESPEPKAPGRAARDVPSPPERADPAGGERWYAQAGCAACHGADGRGARPGVPDWGLGPGAFKGGAAPRDVFRTLHTGMQGSAMPSYAEAGLSPEALWAIAQHVSALAERAGRERAAEWGRFLAELPLAPAGPERKELPSPWRRFALNGREGCLRCHPLAEPINERMQPALLAMSGGQPGKACVLCHRGDPDARTFGAAHRGLIADPGSLWVTGLGLGCAQCHAAPGSLATFQGRPLPAPAGGSLMNVVSRVSDPTGGTGSGHAYRVPRSLMAAEVGKATKAMGAVTGERSPYSDVVMDDPDGAVPAAGSAAYREWVARALDRGFLQRLERTEKVPAYAAALERYGSPEKAALADSLRKLCLRCHLWNRGLPGGGARSRGEGCSACHVLYAPDAPLDANGRAHPRAHRITAQIPGAQCAHCHWSGRQAQFADIHNQRGIDCADCHGSADVHGDGNVYTTMHTQVETACEDCHGTGAAYPWELPVGYGTPVPSAGARGTAREGGAEYLLSSRGNARANLQRSGEAVLLSTLQGKQLPVPLLKGRPGAHLVHAGTTLACPACHFPMVARCMGCHVDYDARGAQLDFVESAAARPGPLQPPARAQTPGRASFPFSQRARFEPPLAVDQRGQVMPMLPGCATSLTARVPGAADPVDHRAFLAELQPVLHQTGPRARSCPSCHASSGLPDAARSLLDQAHVDPAVLVQARPCRDSRGQGASAAACLECHQGSRR